MKLTKTQAIQLFLKKNTLNDLASMYDKTMECQVNVAQGTGERIKGEYKGKQWNGFTNNVGDVWKSFRIPYDANNEPHFDDPPMSFDLHEHAEGIGMTGWDWVNKCSKWVAFDFDAIVGHSDKHQSKLTVEQLNNVKQAALILPWTTVRRSTSGKGLHIYVKLFDIPTANHTEHAALARSILNYMSVKTGFSFSTHVDVCGGNMWVWHRKMRNTDGLTCYKDGTTLEKVPSNWKDHLQVVSGKRTRVRPKFSNQNFDNVASQKQHNMLDDSHLALIKFLDDSNASFWWDNDHHMLVCHTFDLKQAHLDLDLRGVYDTMSTGAEQGVDHNCFLYPLRDGAWVVRRYGDNTNETTTWDQDNSGWTRCFFNKKPDLKTASKCFGGIEHTTGGFVFSSAESAAKAAKSLDVDLNVPLRYIMRETKLKLHKDGRLLAELKRDTGDNTNDMEGWLCEKLNKYVKIYDIKISDNQIAEVGNYDDVVRHVVTGSGQSLGWVIHSEKQWTDEPLQHVSVSLRSMGLKAADVQTIIGENIFRPWQIVNKPFDQEYLGNRCWNRFAAQFRYPPNLDKDKYHCPAWNMVLDHIGKGLDRYILKHEWCKDNLLTSGADYLRCWIGSLFQQPYEPLPYLFLWSREQNTGKSILHEALDLLFTQGYVRADNALQTAFNGELERAVLCIIEETDLQRNKKAYNMIKDYVTGLHISLHVKGQTPIMIPNTTHWIQCANDPTACPLFKGDTRVTVINVAELKQPIPKRDLLARLRKEAPDFLGSVLKLELPHSSDRLNIPVLDTQDKHTIARTNENVLELFISECCYPKLGHMITLREFHQAFMDWLDPTERFYWTKQKISKTMHPSIPKGRNSLTSTWCYGNLSFDKDAIETERLTISMEGDSLVQEN